MYKRQLVDWRDVIYQDVALRQDYTVSVAGKKDEMSYYSSINYLKNESNVPVSYTHLFFDPKDGKSVMSRTIDGVLEILKGRKDIKYKEGVITDYLNQARALVRRMESDGFIYTGDRHQGGIQ